MATNPTRSTAPYVVRVLNCDNDVRWFYRRARHDGVARYEAHLLAAGMAAGMPGGGSVLVRPSDWHE